MHEYYIIKIKKEVCFITFVIYLANIVMVPGALEKTNKWKIIEYTWIFLHLIMRISEYLSNTDS